MKLVIAWLSALVVAIATASSCSINHKSSDYECTVQADCDAFPGRVCTGGFCVTGDGPSDARIDGTTMDGPRVDAPTDAGDCPAQCTSCRDDKHECVIDCATTSCNNEIVCPAGWNCTIACSAANSCTQGIDCSAGNSCNITCSGNQSCRDLDCGTGKCTVACTGRQSCRGMDCSDSCACDITCTTGTNGAACAENSCPLGCGAGFGRCSSAIPNCNDCM